MPYVIWLVTNTALYTQIRQVDNEILGVIGLVTKITFNIKNW